MDASVAHAVCKRNDSSVAHDGGGDGRQRLVTVSRKRADDRREETCLVVAAVARARRVGRPSRHLRRQDPVEARLTGHQR